MRQSRRAYLAHHLAGPGLPIAAATEVAYRARRLAGARREALCGPEAPQLPEVLWKVLKVLGLRVVHHPGPRVAVAVHWSLDTVTPPPPLPGAVNGRCVDISKSRVDEALRAAMGYGAAVDPRRHEGPCVRKSEVNARHDGTLVRAPVARPEPGAVYQRRVDTEVLPGTLEELRTPVVGDAIPFVYVKRRPASDVFGHGPSRAWLAAPDDVMGRAERQQVLGVARGLRLDVGELDVLRDRHDGRLYVVDANRTPWGPPRTLGAREARRAIAVLAAAFEAAHLRPGGRRGAAPRRQAARSG